MTGPASRLIFFLGGRDLEMATIRRLLDQEAPGRLHDKGLAWGARTSAYQDEISKALERVEKPVLVLIELTDDLDLPPDRVIIVDHHGTRAGADCSTSLHQVFELLDLSPARWTRWYALVAANDRGYIPELLRAGATPEEIRQIRTADRAAQGITAAQEAEAERAVRATEVLADGRLIRMRLSHDRTAAVTDRLEPLLGGPGYEALFVESPAQVNLFASGELVMACNQAFSGGWYGGALPERGFWGHGEPLPDALPFLLQWLRAHGS